MFDKDMGSIKAMDFNLEKEDSSKRNKNYFEKICLKSKRGLYRKVKEGLQRLLKFSINWAISRSFFLPFWMRLLLNLSLLNRCVRK